jgi:serine/threonine protein kinase
MENINKKIGNYTITRKIGEGGMASVYEGIHEKLGTKVAIKILSPILARNPQLRKRFENEANFMASLSHPHITRVLDVEEKDDTLAIIMDLLEGEDLDARVKRTGPLSTDEVKIIFTQVMHAFDYAHSKGIVHRDIKPANIFIDKANQVKILDFGIAKLFGTGNEMTQTGTQMGTPVYMSPEQVRGEKSIDHRSDIYALGVTLYFLLTGNTPYESAEDSSYEIFTKIINEPIPSLVNKPTFDAIIQKAVSKDRNARYQVVGEMRKELEASGNPQPSLHVSETTEETLTQEIKATESPKPVQKEEETETKAALENIPTNFFNLNRLLIGVIAGTLIGVALLLTRIDTILTKPIFLFLFLCFVSTSILFFKPTKKILRITITVFALFWTLFILATMGSQGIFSFGFSFIIVISLFCSFSSLNKTAFVFCMLAFPLINFDFFYLLIDTFNFRALFSVYGIFSLIYLCSTLVFFFYKKYFGQFIFFAICCVNIAIFNKIANGGGGQVDNIIEQFYYYSFYLDISKNLLLLLLLPFIELSSRLQPKVPT